MNINDLTLGQIKEIQALSIGISGSSPVHPFIGKYVIARCYSAGVHSGEVVAVDGENVILKNSRRLWSWKAKDGVAQHGIKSDSKVDALNPEIYLTGVCELIPCTEESKVSINDKK